jgi:hypothetical protein
MAHANWFQPWLDDMSAQHPLTFLRRLAPVHLRWHMGALPIGFLTFHKEVLVAFTASLDTVGAAGLLPPPWDEPEFPYDESLDNINDLRQFSRRIEQWHNIVHTRWPEPDFADAQRNIYLRSFWALHRLVDQKFDLCLERNDISFAQLDQDLHPSV